MYNKVIKIITWNYFVCRLEPLLARLKEKPNVVLCPVVDNIDDKTLEYSKNGGMSIGGFTWSLHFTWRTVPKKDRQRRGDDPVKSVVFESYIVISQIFKNWHENSRVHFGS